MKLNNIFAITTAALVILGGLSSCNDKAFLEEISYQNDSDGFYQSERAMEIGLAACYSNVQYMVFGNQRGGSDHNWMVNGMGLDSFAPTGANTAFSNWPTLNADSGYPRHWGDYMYKLVNRANTVVDMIDKHDEIVYSTATKKNELRGEAVFMRAYAYRILAGMFGALVYSDHMTTEARYDYEMLSREEAWAKIAEDFKWAEENLPAKPRLTGTVTKAAAAHFLAETYIALGRFDDAEKAATRVIDQTNGDYKLMTTRFGNRKSDAVDRYGNSLAAPQGAYWDLFRSSAKSDGTAATDSNPNDPENKEAIWVAQIHYEAGQDSYPLGGSGDSWFRMHVPVLESTWAPWLPMGGKNGTRSQTWYDPSNEDAEDGYVTEKFYIFTADATCFPEGVEPAGAGTPASDIPEAKGRKLAYNLSTRMDSLACRTQGLNNAATSLGLYGTEYVTRPYGDINETVWDDPNDFRGSEVMIQRDPYLPSGKRWSVVKAQIEARAAAHEGDVDKDGKKVKNNYILTVSDTVNVTPRYWKFSDDRHPNLAQTVNCYYDCDWYLIRIAETYLLRAEARLAKGDKGGAAADINVVRARAGAGPVAAGSVDIDYILDERIRELFGEEQRWITLSRLSCNPNAKYVLDKYPVQNATTSNTLYERTRKYGFGYENDDRGRETYVDKMGKTRHIPNIQPHNYVLPIPTQIIQSNKDVKIEQNFGY